MKKWVILLVFGLILVSFQIVKPLKGTWQYCGGKFNNKLSPAPEGHTQQRKYTDTQFDAFLLEKGEKPVKYESGTYTLTADSCTETQTYSMQQSKLLNVAVRYQYAIRNDTLVLNGKLPGGAVIEDYWKRVK
jgi:hypothetical protein